MAGHAKTAKLADELTSFFNELTDSLSDLYGALESEDDDMIATDLDKLPSTKVVSSACNRLGELYKELHKNTKRKKEA